MTSAIVNGVGRAVAAASSADPMVFVAGEASHESDDGRVSGNPKR